MRDGQINILVLGVGGNVSQGILKALSVCGLPFRVIGSCVSSRAFGLYTVDKAYISPPANDPTFLDWLLKVCEVEHVHAVLSGVEPILAVLAREAAKIRDTTGAICIVSRPECLAIGDDKLLTCQWLQAQGFRFPRYAASENEECVNALVRGGYPLIAKPRHGKGGHGVFTVNSDEELQAAMGRKGYVIQEYLGDASQEYTVGCFSDSEYRVGGAIVLRRELLDGTTFRAEVGLFPAVREEAIRIAEALRPMGPCNLQMRVHRGVAVCFEINIRFSGTTPIRTRFGFNDVEATIRHFVLGQPVLNLPIVTQGIALRYWNEAYVDPQAVTELDCRLQLDEPRRYVTKFEDYGIRQ